MTALLILGALLFVCFFEAMPVQAKEKEDYKSSYSEVVGTGTAKGIHDVFPESYWEGLDQLLKDHPNWKFQAFNTGLTWNECFDWSFKLYESAGNSEMYYGRNLLEWDKTKTKDGVHPSSWYSTASHKHYNDKYTELVSEPVFNWAGNSWVILSAPDWIQASEEAVRYCMDPRNWFTEEQIFQFEDMRMSADTYHPSAKEVETVFNNVEDGDGIPGNFWTKSANDTGIVSELSNSNGRKMTYAEALYAIGEEIGVSPVFLASRIVQEQGVGSSPLISGTYVFTITSGPAAGRQAVGFYNYFNIEATDGGTGNYTLIYNNGLTEAYNANPQWNTRFRALLGGSKKTKTNYLDRGQISFYFQKFCVDCESNRCLWGQYMGSLTTPQREAAKAYKSYIDGTDLSKLNAQHLFIIPVYEDMPEEPEEEPTKDGNPNYKLGSIYYSQYTYDQDGKEVVSAAAEIKGFSTDTLDYTLPNVDSGASKLRFNLSAYAPTTEISIGTTKKTGTLAVDVALQFGDNTLKFLSTAENGDTRTYTVHVFRYGDIVYGDVNADGKWDNKDTAIMGSHILKNITLKGQAFEAADVNGDGQVNNIDVAIVGAYILHNIDYIKQR